MLGTATRVAQLDGEIVALDISGLTQSLAKRFQSGGRGRGGAGPQHTDAAHALVLLRERCERPGRCCAAKQRDDFAPSHDRLAVCSLRATPTDKDNQPPACRMPRRIPP